MPKKAKIWQRQIPQTSHLKKKKLENACTRANTACKSKFLHGGCAITGISQNYNKTNYQRKVKKTYLGRRAEIIIKTNVHRPSIIKSQGIHSHFKSQQATLTSAWFLTLSNRLPAISFLRARQNATILQNTGDNAHIGHEIERMAWNAESINETKKKEGSVQDKQQTRLTSTSPHFLK